MRPPGSEVRCTLAPMHGTQGVQAQAWCCPLGLQVGREATSGCGLVSTRPHLGHGG